MIRSSGNENQCQIIQWNGLHGWWIRQVLLYMYPPHKNICVNMCQIWQIFLYVYINIYTHKKGYTSILDTIGYQWFNWCKWYHNNIVPCNLFILHLITISPPKIYNKITFSLLQILYFGFNAYLRMLMDIDNMPNFGVYCIFWSSQCIFRQIIPLSGFLDLWNFLWSNLLENYNSSKDNTHDDDDQ